MCFLPILRYFPNPNKKVNFEEDKRMLVRYDHYGTVLFEREELEENGIHYLDDLKELIKDRFNTLRKYSHGMFSLRKRNEMKTLDPTISIDNLYNMELDVIIIIDFPNKKVKLEEDDYEWERIKKAFQTEYQGTVLEGFYARLNQFHETWLSDGRYAPYLAITQSSGSGKTRLVAELRTKGIYVLYICKRSEYSSGYPKSTPYAQQVLDTIRDNKFRALLCGAIEKIKDKGWNTEQFWNIQISGDRECEEFWNTVLRSLVKSESSLPKYNNQEFVKKLFPGIDIPVVCCIDEAHELITRRKDGDTYFVLWRQQIRHIPWIGFFNILLSTNRKIDNFLPPTIIDTVSARTTNFKIFPAYLDVSTTDVLALLAENVEKMNGHDVLLDELEINDAEVGFNHWISLLATNMDCVKSGGNKFLMEDLVIEAYHRHAAIKMPFGFENIDHVIPFKYSSGYGVISIQNKNAKQSTYKSADNFLLINPVSVFGKSHEDYKILGIYTDFQKGETPEKATSELISVDFIYTRSKFPGEEAKIMYIRGVEAFEFDDEINERLSKVLYARPWPLDRYWSTFGENELDGENAIRSFLPIIFEQEEGQSLIDKWEMCHD
uniref:Crinkler family protein n=3 Tax=Rhizophagus irregularis TaxID=588596 RepID=U9T9Y0_RHIID